jgi:uncharacterized protein YndB with AHSA1/START domain
MIQRKQPSATDPVHSSHLSNNVAERLTTCILNAGWIPVTNAQLLQHHQKLPRELASSREQIDDVWRLTIASILNADRSRVFHALTVPEYVEAWLCSPADVLRQLSVSLAPNGFRIKCHAHSGHEIDITASYVMLRRSKVLFTWRRSTLLNGPTSLVLIRLYGEFARTRVCLNHVGLGSFEEYRWHHDMWEASLAKLSALFK